MLAATMELLLLKLRKLHKSWTAWFNALCAFLAFGLPQIAEALPMVAAYMPPHLYSSVFILTLVGNLILRFKTSKPLEYK